MKRSLLLALLLLTSISVWATSAPGLNAAPPADAIVLFDGTKLDAWTNSQESPTAWSIENGVLTGKPGNSALTSRQLFADCQLHLESRGSADGVLLLQGRYLIPLPAAAGTASPDWQSYDITFRAPRFNNDGSLKSPGTATALRNGVLVQDHVELKGSATKPGQPGYEKHAFKLPLVLQATSHQVSFRNLWIRELGVQQLLNGKNLSGWYSYLEKLGKNNDPEGNFKIADGVLHIEGKNFGYVATEQSFANYYLKAVFKWGQHQYAPRATGKRDSGILYHFALTEEDKVWPKSIECQVQEEDCGDFWCVGTMIETPNAWKTEWNMKHVIRTANFENPLGEWNTIEIICNGDQLEHYVNGHLVNSGTNASVSSGKILLQSEGAEVYYRSVELIPY